MFKLLSYLLLMLTCFLLQGECKGQKIADTSTSTHNADLQKTKKDSSKKFNPRIATFRSAVLPGWGQIYNKKYWKLGLIYPALGITAGVFNYNVKTYKELRQAFGQRLRADTVPGADTLIALKYRSLSAQSLRSYRNEFRQNIDYTVLVFIIFWGLNVIDATIDAHLKNFDVSDDISLKIKPGFNPVTNTSGLSFVFSLKNKHARLQGVP